MKPLLVGEANPYGKDPRYALFPWPKTSAGYRLARKVLAMPSPQAYLDAFDRVNLCPSKWSATVARTAAQTLLAGQHDAMVLLGAKVTNAFDMDFEPFTVVRPGITTSRRFVILPHPSGLCRIWNEPGAFERARTALRLARVLSA